MNQQTKFTDKFIKLTQVHPYAKSILAIAAHSSDPDITYRIIEQLFDSFNELDKEKKEGTLFNITHSTPKIELSFAESPEEIKKMLKDLYFPNDKPPSL